MQKTEYLPITIVNGQSQSPAINFNVVRPTANSSELLAGTRPTGLITPATVTGTTLSFLRSADGATWVPWFDRFGNEYTVTLAGSRYIQFDLQDFAAVGFLILRTGTAGTPTNQAQDTTFNLELRRFS